MRVHLVTVLALFVSACSPERSPVEAATPLVQAPASRERLVFLAVGRQGYGNEATRQVALSMEKVARQQGDVNFTLLLGDNFYPTGVTSILDEQWKSKFENLYDGEYLRGMPFYVVAGNHDHQGSIQAELWYSRLQLGSKRWHMNAIDYVRDFGNVDGRPLARIVFLDSITLIAPRRGARPSYWSQRAREGQIRLLREAFSADTVQPCWRIVATHYPSRSLSQNPFSRQRIMSELLPIMVELKVDLYLSANDRLQQIIDIPGEPLHVSVNGGGQKLDEMNTIDTPTQLAVAQRGFGLIAIDRNSALVALLNGNGELSYRRERQPFKTVVED